MSIDTVKGKALDVASETTKGVLNKLLGPSADILGQRLAVYTEKKLNESPYWGPLKTEERRKNIIEMLKIFSEEFNKLSEENKKDISVNIVAPIIDGMMTYFEEPNYKEMFAKLLASSFDKTKDNAIRSCFVDIIKQLNSLDAKLLIMLKNGNALPYVKLFGASSDGTLTPYLPDLFIYSQTTNAVDYQVISSLENLVRLNLIVIRNDIICFDNDYDYFRATDIYKLREETSLKEGKTLQMRKYRVELTNLGNDFISVCCY